MALLAAATGCSPTHDWRDLRPPETDLVVLMPCRPERQARSGVTLGGSPADVAIWSCRAGDASFSLTGARPHDPSQRAAALQTLRSGLLTRPGTDAGPAEPYVVRGAPPDPAAQTRSFAAVAPDGHRVQGRAAGFVHGPWAWQLVLLADRPVPSDVSETFFASPRIAGASVVR